MAKIIGTVKPRSLELGWVKYHGWMAQTDLKVPSIFLIFAS